MPSVYGDLLLLHVLITVPCVNQNERTQSSDMRFSIIYRGDAVNSPCVHEYTRARCEERLDGKFCRVWEIVALGAWVPFIAGVVVKGTVDLVRAVLKNAGKETV